MKRSIKKWCCVFSSKNNMGLTEFQLHKLFNTFLTPDGAGGYKVKVDMAFGGGSSSNTTEETQLLVKAAVKEIATTTGSVIDRKNAIVTNLGLPDVYAEIAANGALAGETVSAAVSAAVSTTISKIASKIASAAISTTVSSGTTVQGQQNSQNPSQKTHTLKTLADEWKNTKDDREKAKTIFEQMLIGFIGINELLHDYKKKDITLINGKWFIEEIKLLEKNANKYDWFPIKTTWRLVPYVSIENINNVNSWETQQTLQQKQLSTSSAIFEAGTKAITQGL